MKCTSLNCVIVFGVILSTDMKSDSFMEKEADRIHIAIKRMKSIIPSISTHDAVYYLQVCMWDVDSAVTLSRSGPKNEGFKPTPMHDGVWEKVTSTTTNEFKLDYPEFKRERKPLSKNKSAAVEMQRVYVSDTPEYTMHINSAHNLTNNNQGTTYVQELSF